MLSCVNFFNYKLKHKREACQHECFVIQLELIMSLETLKKKYLNKKVNFVSGNFAGESGKCIAVKDKEDAIYGKQLTFRLDDGRLVYAQKSEHFEVV